MRSSKGIKKMAETVKNIEGAWIKEQKVVVKGDDVTAVPRHNESHLYRQVIDVIGFFKERTMPGKFEIYKDKAGEFRFRLKAANGQNILASEGYSAKASCVNGIESVKKNSQNPDRFVTKTTASGKSSFSLTATNGQVIGVSQSYESDSGCKNGMKSVAECAPGANVDDQT